MDEAGKILRLHLLKEGEQPDKEIVDMLLDKISSEGQDSLSSIEKKYLDQASQGDIDPEVEKEMKGRLSGKKDWLERIEKGKPIQQDEVDDVPQDILDMNAMNRLNTGTPLQPHVLERVSQNVLDQYVSEGRFLDIPIYILSRASTDAVDSHLYHVMNRIGSLNDLSKLQYASQDMVDKIIKQYGKKGKVLTDDTLQLANPETREEYKEHLNKQKEEGKRMKEAQRIIRERLFGSDDL